MLPHCFSFYTKDKKINKKEKEKRKKRKEREEKDEDNKGAARERQYLGRCTPVAVKAGLFTMFVAQQYI